VTGNTSGSDTANSPAFSATIWDIKLRALDLSLILSTRPSSQAAGISAAAPTKRLIALPAGQRRNCGKFTPEMAFSQFGSTGSILPSLKSNY
jgi:hypothetical protein